MAPKCPNKSNITFEYPIIDAGKIRLVSVVLIDLAEKNWAGE